MPENPPAWQRRERPTLSILLLEDHPDTSRAVSRLLTTLGHRVTSAAKVKDAIELANERDFDLVLSDIGLHDGTGLDFLRELRKTQTTPAIAVSGFGMEDDLARSRDAGFAAHLTKPITMALLEQAIEEATTEPEASARD